MDRLLFDLFSIPCMFNLPEAINRRIIAHMAAMVFDGMVESRRSDFPIMLSSCYPWPTGWGLMA